MRYYKNEDVEAVSMLDKTILIPMDDDMGGDHKVSVLNESAAFYWNQLAEHKENGITAEELLSYAYAEFEDENGGKIEMSVLKTEMEKFLSDLIQSGYVTAQP